MKLIDLCTKIDAFLGQYSDYYAFKIGKTEDIEERKEDYLQEGYQHVWHLLNGSPEEVSEAENHLEDYFINKFSHKNKCQNKRIGGGSEMSNKVYIALKKNNFSIDDIYKDETMIDMNLPANIDL